MSPLRVAVSPGGGRDVQDTKIDVTGSFTAAPILNGGSAFDGATDVNTALDLTIAPEGSPVRVEWYIDDVLFRDDDLDAPFELRYSGALMPVDTSVTAPSGNVFTIATTGTTYTIKTLTVYASQTVESTATFTTASSGGGGGGATFDFATWEASIPDIEDVNGGTVVSPGSFYGEQITANSSGKVVDARDVSSSSGIKYNASGITVSNYLIYGAPDGVKTPNQGNNTLLDSVVAGVTGNGDLTNGYDGTEHPHMDSIQIRATTGNFTITNCRFIAYNNGNLGDANDPNNGGYNSTIFDQSGNELFITDVYIEDGAQQVIDQNEGGIAMATRCSIKYTGVVNITRCVIDEATMKDGDGLPLLLKDAGSLGTIVDLYTRASDGTLYEVVKLSDKEYSWKGTTYTIFVGG